MRGREFPSAEQSAPKRVEADPADVEGALVELLDRERPAAGGRVFVAHLLPDALTDLVGRRLAGPAQITVHLELAEAVVHVHVPSHHLERVVVIPNPLAVETGLAQMDADVEDDAERPHPLAVEHAETIGRIVKVSELLHEPLRIERPSLRMARRPREQTTPGVQLRAVVGRLGDLQVMPGNALVIDGRELAPGVELGDPLGHRPPHSARTREVVGRAGVVDPAFLSGRDHAFQAADLLWDVEVGGAEVGDRTIAGLLHPPLQGIG
ncbi:hypothetical protein ABE10_03345, partial [Bacillus toyonensis]|nr:hypothetical protein [Bacillus toyonensis]